MYTYNNYYYRGTDYVPYGKLNVETAPSSTAVSLTEAKAHLRVDFTNDDTYITTLIDVATQVVEEFTRRKLMDQTLTISHDEFPQYIDLQVGPVSSVTHVKYYDESNALVTLATSEYDVDTKIKPGRIYESKDGGFPNTFDRPNAVVVTFQAGASSASNVPAAIKQALLIIIGRYYEQRQDVVLGTIATELPLMVEHILTPYRLLEL